MVHSDDVVKTGQLCDCCGKSNATTRCSRCRIVYYCSRECQMKQWKKSHSKECTRDVDLSKKQSQIRRLNHILQQCSIMQQMQQMHQLEQLQQLHQMHQLKRKNNNCDDDSNNTNNTNNNSNNDKNRNSNNKNSKNDFSFLDHLKSITDDSSENGKDDKITLPESLFNKDKFIEFITKHNKWFDCDIGLIIYQYLTAYVTTFYLDPTNCIINHNHIEFVVEIEYYFDDSCCNT